MSSLVKITYKLVLSTSKISIQPFDLHLNLYYIGHYIQHGKLHFLPILINTAGNIPQLLVCLGICGID